MKRILKIKVGDESIKIPVRECKGLSRIKGLMFESDNADNLLFDFKKKTDISIHSYFVRFNFMALWLDENNNILEMRIIEPYNKKIKIQRKFSRLVEIPINKRNKPIINELFRIIKKTYKH